MTNEELKWKAKEYLTGYKDTDIEKSYNYKLMHMLLKRVEELELILSGRTFYVPAEIVKEFTKTIAEECIYICSEKGCEETKECAGKNEVDCFQCIENRIKEKYNLTEGEEK